eukprot:UN10956
MSKSKSDIKQEALFSSRFELKSKFNCSGSIIFFKMLRFGLIELPIYHHWSLRRFCHG